VNYFELLLQTQGRLFVLECARISGVVIAAPLAWLNAPLRIRAALVLILAFVVHGSADSTRVPSTLLEVIWVAVTEFVLGAAMGLVVRFIVAMAEVAAEAIAPMLGLGVAQLFDTGSHSNQNILTSILRHVSILIALGVGVHRWLLQALLAGFHLVPVGSASLPAAGFKLMWDLSGQVLLVGARIALPVIAILFIVQLTLAFVSRAAPQLQIFSVGFAIATAVGLITLVLVLPDISRGFIVEYSKVSSHLEQLFYDLGTAP
jgi:flagellar biosynthetic protein FliR